MHAVNKTNKNKELKHYLVRKDTELGFDKLSLIWGPLFAPMHFSRKTPTHLNNVGPTLEARQQQKSAK